MVQQNQGSGHRRPIFVIALIANSLSHTHTYAHTHFLYLIFQHISEHFFYYLSDDEHNNGIC